VSGLFLGFLVVVFAFLEPALIEFS
jgi:hypothetical protein